MWMKELWSVCHFSCRHFQYRLNYYTSVYKLPSGITHPFLPLYLYWGRRGKGSQEVNITVNI